MKRRAAVQFSIGKILSKVPYKLALFCAKRNQRVIAVEVIELRVIVLIVKNRPAH